MVALSAILMACAPAPAPGDSGQLGDPQVRDSAGADSAQSDDTGAHDWPMTTEDCVLVTDLDTPWFTEGDPVAFTVSCVGDLDDPRIEAVRLPDGASFDGQAFAWSTGPADGGRIDAVFSVRPRDDDTALPWAATVTFWVADNADDPDNVPVDPLTYTEEWGLPVFHVDYDGDMSEEYTSATVSFQGQVHPASIKIRGASSAYYTKPGYMLEFDKDELQIDDWGVSRDHLALLTTFDDNSYVRQKLVYDQWAAIADYWGVDRLTPRTFFAVLYLRGEYRGLFVGLDRIDNEFLDQMGFERDANLYKAINHNANFALTDVYGRAKSTLDDGYTKEEGLPEDDFSDLDDLVAFTGGSDAQTLIDGSADWIDLDEFMDWFLLVHYTLSEDSAGKNSYLYNDPADMGFHYTPWDFNHSWGQNWYTYRLSADSLNYYTSTNRVFWAIQSVSSSDQAMWSRFSQMRQDGPFDPDWITRQVDSYYALIEPSAQRDWDKWSHAYRNYSGWASYRDSADDWTSYDEEKAYLYQWLDDRAEVFWEEHP